MEEDDVCEVIRSVIMSEKGGVLLKNLNRDFISLAGEPIPYEKLGFKSLEELLKNIPDVNRSVDRNGEVLYTTSGKNCEHLASLISKQKTSKSKSSNHAKYNVAHHRTGFSGMHQGKRTPRRSSVFNLDHSSKGNYHQKSSTDKKHIPKEKDAISVGKRIGLEPGSGAKIDLPRLRRNPESHRASASDRILRESSRYNDKRTELGEMPGLVLSNRLMRNTEPNAFQIPEKSPWVNKDAFHYSDSMKWRPGMDLRSVLSPNHNRDSLNGRMRSDNLKDDRFSRRGSPSLRGRPSFDVRDLECHRRESMGIPRSSYDVHDLESRRRQSMGIPRSSYDVRDLEFRRRESMGIPRSSYDVHDLESCRRQSMGIPRSLNDSDDRFAWKGHVKSKWDPEDNRSDRVDRKFDLVNGMLRVTINNS